MPPPTPRAMREPRRRQGRSGRSPRRAGRVRGRAASPAPRRRSPAPCRRALARTGRERSVPSRGRTRARPRTPPSVRGGSGEPASRTRVRGTAAKIAATAANESWNPGSKIDVGIQASRTSAPRARKCQRSRGLATSQASEASAPATAARATEGCQPTASTYAPMPPSVRSSRTTRRSRSSQPRPRKPAAMNATFCPETASRWYSPEARKSCRTVSGRPSSSPSTTPRTIPRRSPVVPRPTAVSMRSRRRSPIPDTPPRRPIRRQSPPRMTTWIPCRASQARSSNPPSSEGVRGATTRASVWRIAPRGGERPTGSVRSTRSRMRRPRNVRTSAGTRTAHVVRRAGPVVTSSVRPELPILASSTLWSSASRRSDPHQSPRADRTRASAAIRTSPSLAAIPTRPAMANASSPTCEKRSQFAQAIPAHADPTSSAGHWSSTALLTGSRDPAAARSASDRCPGRRRDRPPTGRDRARSGNR